MKVWLLLLLLLSGWLPPVSRAQEPGTFYTLKNTVGIDQFGRSFKPYGEERPNKQVGMFFWLWIGQPYASGAYDATEILKMPDGKRLLFDFDHQNDRISPNGQAHFWGKPLWGYYNSEDEWVMRRQIQLLIQAGVDYIVFDATNAVTYKPVYLKLMSVISEYLAAGWPAPKTVFYTHSRSMQTTTQLYEELYSQQLYPETWYRVNGKPLIIAYEQVEDDHAEALSRGDTAYVAPPYREDIQDFFSFKRPQWPFDPFHADGFPWIEWSFPQPLHTDVMNVTVASHPSVPMSYSLTRDSVNWGRGWDPFLKKNVAENVDQGTFFQHQWNHALNVDPPHVFVGGWNEWIAYKQPWGGEYMLCDAADREYSRDIEPMSGGYGDAFYIQLIKNIRQYKTTASAAERVGNRKKEIDIHAGIEQWDDVKAAYRMIGEKQPPRDAYGASQTLRYTQPAPRNNLQRIQVCHDDQHIYLLIRAADAIKPYNGDGNWMNLFVGAGQPSLKGWEGYEFLISRDSAGNDLRIARLAADFSQIPVGTARFTVEGNTLQMEIPRAALGIDEKTASLYFKVADGVDHPADIMDYYVSGSVMPMGRLSYQYDLEEHTTR